MTRWFIRIALVWAVLVVVFLVGRVVKEASTRRAHAAVKLVRVDEKAARFEYGRQTRQMLLAGSFDALESLVDSLERVDARWPDGRRVVDSVYGFGFGEVDDPKDPQHWERLLSRLREWRDARDQSVVAKFGLAEALIARAWAARGEGYANEVSKQEWARFHQDLEEAGQLLRQLPESARETYEWHSAMANVLHSMGGDNDEAFRRLTEDGLRRFPRELRFYTSMTNHLLPRWYGEPGEWERFADEATRKLPAPLADEFYARIVADQMHMTRNVFRDNSGLSWERTQRGVIAWHERCPGSVQPLSAGAVLASLQPDRGFARRCFQSLGDTVETELWRSEKWYWDCRDWALVSR